MRISSVVLLLAAGPAAALTVSSNTTTTSTGPASPQSALIGVWESTATSTGGIGQIVELTADGRFIQTTGFIRDGYYRVIGDRLVVAEKPPAPDADPGKEPTFRIDGNTLAVTGLDGSTNRLDRTGRAEPGKPSIVGVWIDHSLGSPAYTRFGDDGRWSYRMAAASRTDRYQLDGNVLTLTGSGRPAATKVSIELSGDRLFLTGADGRRSEFRKVVDLWYDRDIENVGLKRRLDPKARLAKAESDLENAKGELNRFYALDAAAMLNAETGSPERASSLAHELLETAERHRDDWNYGNAIHKGNLSLGLVSLHAGDVAEAKKRLLAAGTTPGSGQLDTFGPNMVLAKELLEKGERDAVIEYFDLCRSFWKMDRGKLTEWTNQVRAGSIPEFGGNLLY